MNLIESMLRIIALIAIVGYRHQGSKDLKCNRIIGNQLPWPSMGTWKNILSILSATPEDHFPDQFHKHFVNLLKQKMKDPAISNAFGYFRNVVEYASTKDDALLLNPQPAPCTLLEFFELAVSYRNDYSGHGTHDITKVQSQLIPHLRKGVMGFYNPVSKFFSISDLSCGRNQWIRFTSCAVESFG